MKIKFGALVTDGRGKLGGHVASKNRSGNYLRTKTTPTNPQTTFQTAVRALFGAISQGWSALTEAQRISWRNAVDSWKRTDIFGDLKRPTGKALYQRLNQQAQVVGYPAITDAPEPSEVASDVLSGVAINTTVGTITFGGLVGSDDSTLQVFATEPLSAGTKFVKNKLRAIYFDTSSGVDPADIFSAYQSKFGLPVVGQNIYFGAKFVDANGNSTPLQVLQATISA